MTTAFFACILVIVTFLAPETARAQVQQPQVFGITLREEPTAKPGRVGAIQGVTDQEGHRFLIEDLDIMQPVVVALVAREPAHPLKLQLLKYDWNKPDRSGVTSADGIATFRVRTQGEMKIFVTSETPQAAPYYLLVWVGDEIQPEMGTVLVPPKAYKQPKGTSSRD
jgi:hypothetical protein